MHAFSTDDDLLERQIESDQLLLQAIREQAEECIRDRGWTEHDEDFWIQVEDEMKRQWEEEMEREFLKRAIWREDIKRE